MFDNQAYFYDTGPFGLATLCALGATTFAGHLDTVGENAFDAAATSGMDCCLVFHRVVGVDAAAQSVEISVNRLREICVAIKALVDAGSIEAVVFSELAY